MLSLPSPPGTRPPEHAPDLRLPDARATAARCGIDAVRLRPAWQALIAAGRFGRDVRWLFGNAVATIECTEPRPKRWLTEWHPLEGLAVEFDFGGWRAAYARGSGKFREIEVFGADGSPIAIVRIGDFDSALDELIWTLVDDERDDTPWIGPAAGPPESAGAAGTRPLPARAAIGALRAGIGVALPLRVCLENAGGCVCWMPSRQFAWVGEDCIELHSAFGRLRICANGAQSWAVANDGEGESGPSFEVELPSGRPAIRIELSPGTAAQRDVWRYICANAAAGADGSQFVTSIP